MSRIAVTTLACVTAIGLSCALPPQGDSILPSVAAAPPSLESTEVAPVAVEPAVAAVIRHIESRGETGMTGDEIAEVAAMIVAESDRHRMDPALILAVIHVESRFDPFAFSSAGAMGLMQILPSTGAELAAREGVAWRGPQSLFDPALNVRLGIAYLKELADRYGNTSVALAAYNWGPGHIDGRLRRGTPMPTVYPELVREAYVPQYERSS
jgi:soluble lytic murein transglycosylase-like protein